MTISSFTWYCGTTLPGEVISAALEAYHFEPHFHDAWSVGAIVAGCCTFSCHGTTHIARQTDVVIIPPRAVHTGGTSATALCYGMAYLETEWFDAHAKLTHGAPAGFPAVVISDAALCERWAAALTHPELSDAQRKQAISLALLELLAKYGVRSPPTPGPVTAGDACAELQASMRELDLPKADVDGLARRWGMHRTTLSKRFAQRYGLPPDTWLRNWRAAKAKALIRDGVPLADVAAATGFADQAHLTRVFKRIYGAAPGALRKSSISQPKLINGEPKA